MKTALVTDWLNQYKSGGEKTFEALYRLFPSPIYTLQADPKAVQQAAYRNAAIHTSFIQNLPFSRRLYKHYFPLFPLAIEQFDLSSYDLILSTSHCAAKGVLTHHEQRHLCYCYTPVRYAWDLYHEYLLTLSLPTRLAARYFLHRFRKWDLLSAPRVDAYAVISHYIAKRLQKIYGRPSTVIYPPVDIDHYELSEKKESFYLTASRLVPYKKIELIVEAFSHMPNRRLVVIGDGPQMAQVKEKARKNIEVLGFQSDQVMKEMMQKARGFVFAAIEDFGIVPIEAQSCGTPVIAFGKGAVRETLIEGETGLFFGEQTVSSICQAVERFEQRQWDPKACRAQAERFSLPRFQTEYRNWVREQTEA